MSGWFLKRNELSRQPNAHVVLDCEAHRAPTLTGETQTFRLAVAAAFDRPANDCPWGEPRWGEFESAGGLWAWVARQARHHQRTVIVAHNAMYDLRVADGVGHLAALGWELEPPMVSDNRVLVRFRRKNRRLVLVDSSNWLPWPLARIGEALGTEKPPLPDEGGSREEWFARCHQDVAILLEAWRRLVDWVQGEDLGNWQPTGAGQALTAFRHRFMTDHLLVHSDPGARSAEREAAWCGRAEPWRWGPATGGPFDEWDMRLAYCTVMEESDVPTVLRGHHDRQAAWEKVRTMKGRCGLARVTVTTGVPVVPARGPHGILWPIGTFETTLWGHELDLVPEHGGTYTFQEGWHYSAAPALRDFAKWLRAIIDAPDGQADPITQLAAKHFSRAVVGKFGTRYWEWERHGDAPDQSLRLMRWCDIDNPSNRLFLTVAGHSYVQGDWQDSGRSCPQVMSWVQAETRARLWRAIVAAGPGHALYCDTDGLIVDQAGSEALAAAALPGFRRKATYSDVEVISTRRLVADGRLRAAGVPKGAARQPDGSWVADVWAQPMTSMRRGEMDRVTIRRAVFHLGSQMHRRVRLPGGNTGPVALG